jgi:hypothetical protein
LASTVQVPGPANETVPPLIEHAPAVLAESMLNVTGLPDAPPVAAGVYVPPTTAGLGGVDVKVTACDTWATVMTCWD